MDNLWKWLMRANARGVFLCSWAALVLVTAWWTWKQFAPLETEAWVPSLPSKDIPEGLDVLDVIYREFNLEPVKDPVNPFKAFRVHTPRPVSIAGKLSRPKPPEADPASPNVSVKPKPPVPVEPTPAPPPPPPPPEMITVTYKGILERPDGQIMALFHDSKSGASAFYHAGDALYGMRIKAVQNDAAELTLMDGSSVTLYLKESKPFERGKHAN